MGLLRWVGTSFAVAATGAGAFVWYKNRPPPREELMAIELEDPAHLYKPTQLADIVGGHRTLFLVMSSYSDARSRAEVAAVEGLRGELEKEGIKCVTIGPDRLEYEEFAAQKVFGGRSFVSPMGRFYLELGFLDYNLSPLLSPSLWSHAASEWWRTGHLSLQIAVVPASGVALIDPSGDVAFKRVVKGEGAKWPEPEALLREATKHAPPSHKQRVTPATLPPTMAPPELYAELASLLVAKYPVISFGATYCKYCKKANDILARTCPDYKYVEYDSRSDGLQLQSAVQRLSGLSYIPVVVIGGRVVPDGSAGLERLEAAGALVSSCVTAAKGRDKFYVDLARARRAEASP